MRWSSIEDKWFRFKAKAKQEWGALSDAQLDEIAGDRDRLERAIAVTYGKAPDEVRFDVSSWKERVAAA
jgi:uncharacterized protein YjbJ (UPF0337 family)